MAEQGTGKWKVGKSEGRSGGEAESERGKAERSGNVGKRSSYEGVPLTPMYRTIALSKIDSSN